MGRIVVGTSSWADPASVAARCAWDASADDRHEPGPRVEALALTPARCG